VCSRSRRSLLKVKRLVIGSHVRGDSTHPLRVLFCSSILYVGVAQCEVVVYWMRLREVIR
jgi:hypothetical protein